MNGEPSGPAQGADDDVREMLRASARQYATDRLPRGRLRGLRESSGCTVAAWLDLAELGWTGLLVPADQGGSGLGLREMSVVLEEVGRQAAPEPIAACAVLAARAIAMSDQPALRDDLLRRLAAGTLVPALAWQESESLMEESSCRTRAVRHGQGWRLRGAKRFVRPGLKWHGVVVPADTGEGCALFWVEAGTQGLVVTPRLLADGSHCADIALEDLQVGQANLLASAPVGAGALAGALDLGRLAAAAELLGVMRGALETALEHLRTRVQFGVAIGTFQALRHRVVELYLQKELVSASLDEACRLADAGASGEALAALAARVKARASAAALQVAKETIQFHGAMGYTDECDAGLLLKRALTLSAWLGNAPELRARQARVLPIAGSNVRGARP